jgi:hypothetical protein
MALNEICDKGLKTLIIIANADIFQRTRHIQSMEKMIERDQEEIEVIEKEKRKVEKEIQKRKNLKNAQRKKT